MTLHHVMLPPAIPLLTITLSTTFTVILFLFSVYFIFFTLIYFSFISLTNHCLFSSSPFISFNILYLFINFYHLFFLQNSFHPPHLLSSNTAPPIHRLHEENIKKFRLRQQEIKKHEKIVLSKRNAPKERTVLAPVSEYVYWSLDPLDAWDRNSSVRNIL